MTEADRILSPAGRGPRRHDADLEAIDRLTVEGYRPIQESYVSMLGEDCYEVGAPATGVALGRA